MAKLKEEEGNRKQRASRRPRASSPILNPNTSVTQEAREGGAAGSPALLEGRRRCARGAPWPRRGDPRRPQVLTRYPARSGPPSCELHGCAHRVVCLDCGAISARKKLQDRFVALNPGWKAQAGVVAPDGDVFLEDEQVLHFRVPPCEACGGTLKPEVTFFGDTVSKATVQFVQERLAESDAVLVTGSSLQVYSGYRFLLAASERKLPIAILNIGPTRADHLAEVKVSGRCGEVLPLIQPS